MLSADIAPPLGRAIAEGVGIACLTWLLSRLLSDPRNPWQVWDHPNARSLHAHPTPRVGGIAILIGGVIGFALLPEHPAPGLLVALGALGAIAILSWLDDRRGVSPRLRLLVHGVAACVAVLACARWPVAVLPGIRFPLAAPWAVALMTVFLVWTINLYNFMDGMDGFAGGMAVCGFGALAALALRAQDLGYARAALVIAFSALGFTISNFPPARLFMGDLGATTLGFAAGLMILIGAERGDFPVWAGLVVFSPFFVDATATLIRRLVRGEHPMAAHREHYYQRAVRLGFGHRSVVLGEYALMALCAAGAYLALGRPAGVQWAILAALAALYAFLARWIRHREGHGHNAQKASG